MVRHYWRSQRLWSGSYFAGSAGEAPLSIVHRAAEPSALTCGSEQP
ncbi:hypothetical protein ACFVRD_42000 [Streptomyces sp. NPDC057908]